MSEEEYIKNLFDQQYYNPNLKVILKRIVDSSDVMNIDENISLKEITEHFDRDIVDFKLLYKFYSPTSYDKNNETTILTEDEILKLLRIMDFIASTSLFDVIILSRLKNININNDINLNTNLKRFIRSVTDKLCYRFQLMDAIIKFDADVLFDFFYDGANHLGVDILKLTVLNNKEDMMFKCININMKLKTLLTIEDLIMTDNRNIIEYWIKHDKTIEVRDNSFLFAIDRAKIEASKVLERFPRTDENAFNYAVESKNLDAIKYVVSLGYKPVTKEWNTIRFGNPHNAMEFDSLNYALMMDSSVEIIEYILNLNVEVKPYIKNALFVLIRNNNYMGSEANNKCVEILKLFIDRDLFINDIVELTIQEDNFDLFKYCFDKITITKQELMTYALDNIQDLQFIKFILDSGYEHSEDDYVKAIMKQNVPAVKLFSKVYNKRHI